MILKLSQLIAEHDLFGQTDSQLSQEQYAIEKNDINGQILMLFKNVRAAVIYSSSFSTFCLFIIFFIFEF